MQLQALGNVLEDLGVAYLRAFGVIRGPAEQFQVALQAEVSIDRQVTDIARLLTKLKKKVAAAESYKRQLERLRTLLRDYSALGGRSVPADLANRLDRAIALADVKIAELTPKPKPPKKRRTRR